MKTISPRPHLSTHCVERYIERVKPLHTYAGARDELERLIDLSEGPGPAPPWVHTLPGDTQTSYLTISDGIALVLEEVDCTRPGHDRCLLATTLMQRCGEADQNRIERHAAKKAKRKKRHYERHVKQTLGRLPSNARKPQTGWEAA